MADPLILTPGPVAPPDFVMDAIRKPVIHQRSTAFEEFFAALQQKLQYLFQTSGPVLGFPGTGTQGVEVALYSLFGQSDRLLVLDNGKFSHRWEAFARSMFEVESLSSEWGKKVGIEALRQKLSGAESPYAGVVITHCETSTGVEEDLEEMAFAIRELMPEALIVVDAVSTLGAVPVYMDAWQVDVACSAGQKGLMNPAGTAWVALGKRGLERVRQRRSEAAFHLYPYLDFLQKNSYPYTPPTQLFYGIEAAADFIQKETLPTRWNRVHQQSRSFKKGIEELGGELFGEANSDALTVFSFPGQDTEDIRRQLLHDFGIEVAGGQGHLKGKILRVGHFGSISQADIEACHAALAKISGG